MSNTSTIARNRKKIMIYYLLVYKDSNNISFIEYCKGGNIRKEKVRGKLLKSINRTIKRTAEAIGIGQNKAIYIVYKSANKTKSENQRKGNCGRKKKLDSFDCEINRNKIHSLFRNKELFSIKSLQNHPSNDLNISYGLLCKSLFELGFRYRKFADCKRLREESFDIINQRCSFLRRIRDFREQKLHIVYLDETWVNAHHGRIFRSKTNSADDHDEMCGRVFIKWFREKLIPSLKEKSVIVLDNATYHNVRVPGTESPTMAMKKADFAQWLTVNGIHFPQNCLKPELLLKNTSLPFNISLTK
ncbi:hypothetical protein KUTeg_017770 [Tegillarca granosa]|uniref:Tc1-like transposase DDE domain-containing protein n=1 Tax=Tegillarca granosa TaxID=220873 RepID=A0ABQ9EJR8_TEGGR|nr:hypothetical protein KUTeg_017770 [Tegillarca granosa]